MKFCSECAKPICFRVPEGDTLPRFVCEHCGEIFYQNPRLVVGTLPIWEEEILICRRSIEPRRGYWTLPSGYLENGEGVEEGAQRETIEEAGADVEMGPLYAVYNLPHVNQVYMIFLARLKNLDFSPGEESLEVKLVRKAEIPWERMAFRAIEFALERYCKDRGRSATAHIGSYSRSKDGRWIRGHSG